MTEDEIRNRAAMMKVSWHPTEGPETELRKRIIVIARSWLGTPFNDNQGLKGIGVDCAYLIARVYGEAGLVPDVQSLPYYSPQIYLHNLGDSTYLNAVLQFGHEITEVDVESGDMVLFKVGGDSFAHGGIIESWPDCIIHPFRPHGVICSSSREGFIRHRQRRFFSIFQEKK